jgi:N-acetylmuramoyl-L-alanine amidase
MLVVLDPGHGGRNPGAVAGGVKEKDINLLLAREVASNLRGCRVVLTREEDVTVSLKERVQVANKGQADLFLSLHSNAGGGHGFESFVYPRAMSVTRRYRELIHGRVMEALRPYGLRDRGMKEANFHVLRETRCPAVLLESLFLDHSRERELLVREEFRRELGAAVAAGVRAALGLPESRVLYTVQVGAFWNRGGAEDCLARAREAGFGDAFIVTRPLPG